MTLRDAISGYILDLTTARYSKSTLDLARTWLNRFATWCEKAGLVALPEVTDQHVADYQRYLFWVAGMRGVPYSHNTVSIGMRMVRYFWSWAARQRHILVNPCRNLVLRRVPPQARPPVTPAQMERFLAVPDTSRPCGLRDRAVMELMYGTGMRRGECLGLDLEDLHLDDGLVLVRNGKGGRQRWLPLGESLTAVLRRYLAEARPQLCKKPGEPAVFLGQYGIRFSTQSLQQTMRAMAVAAGLPIRGTHSLRHAFATHLLENGADLVSLQAFLGHRFLTTTQVYAQVLPVELRRAYQATHPRARRQH